MSKKKKQAKKKPVADEQAERPQIVLPIVTPTIIKTGNRRHDAALTALAKMGEEIAKAFISGGPKVTITGSLTMHNLNIGTGEVSLGSTAGCGITNK